MSRNVWVFALAIVLGVRLVSAQATTGTISGIVHDATGAVVPGATITIRNVETGSIRTVSTDAQGRYVAPNLSVGKYEVQTSMTGFQTAVRSGIELTVGREAAVNLSLQVGQASERVEVTGEAPLVEATNATISGVVDDRAIRDLPLNGRSFDQLVLLQVGTISARRDQAVTALGGGAKISISGARPSQNSFLLDGTDINDSRNAVPGGAAGLSLGVDTIREFRVLTNSYSAEYGRAAGGVVTAVTRSGTNELRGSAFEFLRNSKLDARNFFDVDSNNPNKRSDPPAFKRNQFGITAGGPIRHDRTFFFGSYEGLRERLGLTRTTQVPNEAARRGELAAAPQGVQIPAGVRPWLNLYPLPNGKDLGNGTGDFTFVSSRNANEDYVSGRLDHSFSSTHSVFGRYTFDDSDRIEPRNLPFDHLLNTGRSQYLTVQADSVLSAVTLNAFRFGINRSVARETTQYEGISSEMTFVPGVPFELGGSIEQTGFATIGDYLTPKSLAYTMFEWSDDVTRVQGRHTLKAGALFKKVRDNQDSVNAKGGRYQFRGGLLDFLRGVNGNFTMQWPGTDQYRGWRQSYFGVYVQDDVKITPTLTANVGVREEFLTSPNEVNGKCSNVTDVLQTSTTVGCPFFETFKQNWAPRVGFAWDTRGNARLVLRGGWGLFFDQPFSTYWRAAGRFSPPYIIIYNSPGPVNFLGGLPDLSSPPTSGFDIRSQKYTGTSYVMQYNFNIQSEIRPGTGVTIGYMGSQGRKLFRTGQMNTRIPEILSDGRKRYPTAANSPRINPFWVNLRVQQTDANSNYNAFVLSVNQRFRGGMRLQGSYTFSKIMSDSDRVFGRDFSGGELSVMDPLNPKLDRALAGYHLSHNYVSNFSYDLPLRANGAVGKLIEGWQLSGIFNLSSGAPVSAITTAAVDGTTGALGRYAPNLVPGQSTNPSSGTTAGCENIPAGKLGTPDRYFDPCAFAFPAAGVYGDLGRNTIIGPGLVTIDFSLVKKTSLTERSSLQFRAEFFNLFNRANFGDPAGLIFGAVVTSRQPTAGRISNTSTTSRQIQLGLKIEF